MPIVFKSTVINPKGGTGPAGKGPSGGGGGGGSSLITSFTDTFNRANGRLGANWAWGATVDSGVAPHAAGNITIAVSAGDGGQCIAFTTVGPTNPATYWRTGAIALPLVAGVNGVNQYSELKNIIFNQTAGAAANIYRAGPSVLHIFDGNGSSFYALQAQVQTANKLWVLSRFNNSNTQTTLVAGAIGSFVNTNLLRLEAIITASDVTLKSYVAGSLVDTTVDSSASRLTAGSPGMVSTELGHTAGQVFAIEFRNFAGGRL